MADEKKNFTVQIAETRNYQLQVQAEDEAAAEIEALALWKNAPCVGGWEIDQTVTDVVAVTKNNRQP